MVTERMLLAAATATALASRCESGDRFLMWEPLHHIGGSQLCVLALLECIRLHLISRFSASRFWNQVREFGITRLHYLGGVLDILLSAPESTRDSDHPALLAFGAGARADTWRAFSERFQVTLHEVYGMTEASSFSTLNEEGVFGSVGRALPWFELELVDPDGNPLPEGPGELTVRAREPGLLTPGYLGNPEATQELLRDGRLFTGDLMRRDEAGNLYYVGRRGDAIRRRGENLSAWEIEQALLLHPHVAEAAVLGVAAEIGEQEVHAFILSTDPDLTCESLLTWCRENLGRHQVPRYFSFVDEFPRTPSERIAKSELRATL
jgi:crotonobetaine/carnitine-CoA ligase